MSDLFSSEGLFWTPSKSTRDRTSDIPAIFRGINWPTHPPPRPLPDLKSGVVALDFETDDPTLNTVGPAWSRSGIGSIIGMAIAYETEDGIISDYYSIGHTGGNCDRNNICNWLSYNFSCEDILWVFSKASYDLGYAHRDVTSCYPKGKIVDVQHMAAILDEYRLKYGLDSLATDYLGVGKETTLLDRIEKEYKLTHSQVMQHLKHAPGYAIAPYAATDALRTKQLYHHLLPLIEKEDLLPILKLESELIPLCTEMQRRGIRVDVDGTVKLREQYVKDIESTQAYIKSLCGIQVEPWEGETCARALETQGIKCPKTTTGKASVTSKLLDQHSANSIAQQVLVLRKLSKNVTTFLDGHILGCQHNGRIHYTLNQLRRSKDDNDGDDKDSGTVGTIGRFSVTDPNLQQIPRRDPEFGKPIRDLFLPDEGYEYIASLDYSGQEPRLATHFAAAKNMRGAQAVVQKFVENPKLSFHRITAQLCNIAYDPAKTLFLARLYGQGGANTSKALKLPTEWMIPSQSGPWKKVDKQDVARLKAQGKQLVEVAGKETKELIKKMDSGVPFIKELFDDCLKEAKTKGYITTILGRRCRFPEGSDEWLYKALNYKCQSSAADQAKQGMLDLWNAGIVPLLPIHDENLFNANSKEDVEPYARIMENAIELLVPSVVEIKLGRTWGDVPK